MKQNAGASRRSAFEASLTRQKNAKKTPRLFTLKGTAIPSFEAIRNSAKAPRHAGS
ncbi:hypothetical protein [Paraburkholderia sp. GAS42]|jgi:hypothetical protein|uniref:hypothetical protein n=1 Tax=Paraburkholderia sp. GAS42 TaxID=3035135 RepID=UPI003D21EF47